MNGNRFLKARSVKAPKNYIACQIQCIEQQYQVLQNITLCFDRVIFPCINAPHSHTGKDDMAGLIFSLKNK
jgi:hypothetical protein